MAIGSSNDDARRPTVLIVPGIDNSGPDHWQTHWEREHANHRRVDLGMWDAPHRNTWVNKLNLAIYRAGGPVVLVAHSLGCVTVAWWVEFEKPTFGHPVIGALLVAPPDVERPGRDPRLARFGACPRGALPFPSFLVASRDDPYCPFATSIALARDWGSHFVDVGEAGHLNVESNLGDWPEGKRLLARLLGEHRVSERRRAARPAGVAAGIMRGRPRRAEPWRRYRAY